MYLEIKDSFGYVLLSGCFGTLQEALDYARENNISLYGACFSGQCLVGLDFRGLDLGNADFTYADMRGCLLGGANTEHALFAGADMEGVDYGGFDSLKEALVSAAYDDLKVYMEQ